MLRTKSRLLFLSDRCKKCKKSSINRRMLRHELEAIKMKFSDRQTDRQTDRRKEKMGCSTSGLRTEYKGLFVIA